jgi:hypothetical protein
VQGPIGGVAGELFGLFPVSVEGRLVRLHIRAIPLGQGLEVVSILCRRL